MILLSKLPYDKSALEPYISEKTLSFHYDKHHAGYVNKLNELIKGKELDSLHLEKIISSTHKDDESTAVFNNAAQVWNHAFYWDSMCPGENTSPNDELMKKIRQDFGDIENLKKELALAASTQFGSGWAWLVHNSDTKKIEVIKTSNADTPLVHSGLKPLLAIDVWEHAYYLDYQNRRPDYIATFLDKLINWKFASANYLS